VHDELIDQGFDPGRQKPMRRPERLPTETKPEESL